MGQVRRQDPAELARRGSRLAKIREAKAALDAEVRTRRVPWKKVKQLFDWTAGPFALPPVPAAVFRLTPPLRMCQLWIARSKGAELPGSVSRILWGSPKGSE